MKRVAIVGAGISGLGAAHALARHAHVTLFEAGAHFGGHAHTVDVTLPGADGRPVTHGVDIGFLVFNHRTYPNLLRLFGELEVPTAPSDMGFSVQVPQHGLEWSGSSLDTVFAQRRNLLRPRFLRMLQEVLRFNREATALAERGADSELNEPIGDFLDREGFSDAFRDWYFLPMIGCIWSCPTDQMLRFPVGTMIRFCHNHGLIQVNGRPQWHTVAGGSREYVRRILPHVADARLGCAVQRVERDATGGVWVQSTAGREHFDEVILATHSDQSLRLLADARDDERAVLGAIRYHGNTAVLHTDTRVLPQRQRAWAAWNYVRAAAQDREQAAVCLHYLINRLQPLPFAQPVIVSLNPDPAHAPDPSTVLGRYDYAHPIFDLGAVAAQRLLPSIQGQGGVWFCGAWARYGFHEDGLSSGLDVVDRLLVRWRAALPGAWKRTEALVA